MIELIFVIVIIGILAVVAIPKIMATRDDAYVAQMSHTIATAATEIASYAISQGTIEDNLSAMSQAIAVLVARGEATEGNKTVDFKMGQTVDCIHMQVDDGIMDANLSVTLSPMSLDRKCDTLQSIFDTSRYPIPLRGPRLNYDAN